MKWRQEWQVLNKMENDIEKRRRFGIIKNDNKRFILINLNIFLLGIAAFFGVCTWKYFSLKRSFEGKKDSNINVGQLYKVDYLDNAKVLGESSENQIAGIVKGETAADSSQETDFSSEDFKIKQINITGNPNVELEVGDEGSPLSLSGIKNEVFSSKDADEIKAVVSLKTNRLAISEIGYSKNGEDLIKDAKEDDFGIDHNIILPSLDADSVYNFTIKARDRDGNSMTSDKFAFYTGAPNVSFVDVLEEAGGKLFGWAMKK